MGTILRVDLTSGTITEQEYTEEFLKKYVGQDCVATRILYNEMPPWVGALDPDSRLIFSVGPLVGTKVQASCDHSVSAKSPQSGKTIYNAHSHGGFAIQLKSCGYDVVIIQGKAVKPVYISLNNGKVEIKNATHLWGKDTWETQDIIAAELGQPKVSCDCIGPAGENLVLLAGIVTDKDHIAARGGLGAVMGSKNLKAIAAYGQKKVTIANPARFSELSAQWRKDNIANVGEYPQYGTASSVALFYQFGDVPIKNWSCGTLDGIEKIDGKPMVADMFKKHVTCPSCSIAHRKVLELKGPEFSGECALPEYEVIAAMGSLLGVTDPMAVCMSGQILDKYGLDALGTGTMIAWAMECTEKGILTKADTDGLDLRWGNYKAAHEMISMIAKREGFGNILANGPIPAVKHVGNGSEKFMVQIKGMTIPMHDHRAVWGHGLSYAVGSVGHEGGPIGLELFGGVPRFSIEKKAQLVKDGQSSSWSLANILGVCAFGTYGISPGLMADTLSAVVGLEFSVDALTKVAMRGVNLRHAFGIRNGLTPADDTLPYRYTDDPTMDGGAKGSKIPIKQLVSDYYNVMGWDPITGKPYRETLIELGLNKEANDLWGDGNLC